MIRPSLRHEKSLLRQGHHLIAGCDEVGRGALGGPVSVGFAVVDAETRRVPKGLADSKMLTPERREALVPAIRRWSRAHSVGHASAAEIDAFGLMRAMRLAALRALVVLPVSPDVIVLDGNHDYLSPREEQGELFAVEPDWPEVDIPNVSILIKADMYCASVSAASVLAKTSRDALMVQMSEDYPQFGWANNKGYASPEHMDQLAELGPCEQHRRSWRLPGQTGATLEEEFA